MQHTARERSYFLHVRVAVAVAIAIAVAVAFTLTTTSTSTYVHVDAHEHCRELVLRHGAIAGTPLASRHDFD